MKVATIHELIDRLTDCEQDAEVFIDNRRPTALSSYRGYCDNLAIERMEGVEHAETALDELGEPFELNMAGYGTYTPGHGEVTIKHPATVAELRKALTLAIDAEFEGYKGGQFLMDPDTELWVSQYGSSDGLRIVGVERLPGRVDLLTVEDRGW